MTPENLRTTFNLRAYMDACGFRTHQELADASGFSLDTIRSFSAGRAPINARAERIFSVIAQERGVGKANLTSSP